jgi:hypothetical protein
MIIVGKDLPDDLFPFWGVSQTLPPNEGPKKIKLLSHHHPLLQFSINNNSDEPVCQYLFWPAVSHQPSEIYHEKGKTGKTPAFAKATAGLSVIALKELTV